LPFSAQANSGLPIPVSFDTCSQSLCAHTQPLFNAFILNCLLPLFRHNWAVKPDPVEYVKYYRFTFHRHDPRVDQNTLNYPVFDTN
jgi:hypothetical protein